jgi:RNA 2',3'-cyclic 3'-phosphodiesterase
MRLFTGIDLSEEIIERLERLLMHVRPIAHLKWSPVYNLHLTLKFIGEWPEQKLPQLDGALRSIPPRPAFPAEVKGVGWYPNAHHPRVFWVAVHGGEPLLSLVGDIEAALAPLGIAREVREFSAHLTLARIKDPVPLQPLRNAIAHMESLEFGSFTPDRFFLYRSQPGSAGSIYTRLSEFPFQSK